MPGAPPKCSRRGRALKAVAGVSAGVGAVAGAAAAVVVEFAATWGQAPTTSSSRVPSLKPKSVLYYYEKFWAHF